jgi:hypothetical protein
MVQGKMATDLRDPREVEGGVDLERSDEHEMQAPLLYHQWWKDVGSGQRPWRAQA